MSWLSDYLANAGIEPGVDSLAKSGDTPLLGDVTLSAGSNVTLTQAGQNIAIASTGGGGGATWLDYVTRSTDLTVTATSAGAAETWIDGNAVVYDGSTRIMVMVYSALVIGNTDTIIELYRDSTDIGRLAQYSGTGQAGPVNGVYFDTPTVGSHTYHAKAWKAGGGGLIFSSLGCPSFLRITIA